MKDEQIASAILTRSGVSPSGVVLRPFREGDAAAIVRHADNPRVARYLRERFPQPYTRQVAEGWIASTLREQPPLNLAITREDQVIGGVGMLPERDIHRVSAEVGYWVGETEWGRGIATCALQQLVTYAFDTFDQLNRLFAFVDEEHAASIRVLEKNGFRCEGRLIGAAILRGEIRNQFLYALTRAEAESMRS